jgi:hypothetical protein
VFKTPRSIFLAHGFAIVATRLVVTQSLVIALLVFLSAPPAAAQAAAEYGHIATGTSAAANAGAGLAARTSKLDSALSPGKKSSTVSAASSQSVDVVETEKNLVDANRRALEQSAGQNAATLTLKSAPVKAMVRINGKPVGQTPLQLSLAPGTYKIEMEGPRMEAGKQQLDLSAQEKRELELQLSAAPRYPSHITLQ